MPFPSRWSPNTKDAKGRVRVLITLKHPDGRNHTPGNVTRTLTMNDSTVGKVSDLIEKLLYSPVGRRRG